MLEVCLTGGIASGKSLAAERFGALGVPVADSDVAAREMVAPGSTGLDRVIDAFGQELLTGDGELDRRALRQRIFTDDEARERLENILHPLIRERIEQQMRQWSDQGHAYALQVVPLLVETGLHHSCERILVVDAPESIQIERLARRDGDSEERARAIMGRQARRWQRLEVATDVIDNGNEAGPDTAIMPQVRSLHAKFTALGRAREQSTAPSLRERPAIQGE